MKGLMSDAGGEYPRHNRGEGFRQERRTWTSSRPLLSLEMPKLEARKRRRRAKVNRAAQLKKRKKNSKNGGGRRDSYDAFPAGEERQAKCEQMSGGEGDIRRGGREEDVYHVSFTPLEKKERVTAAKRTHPK